MKPKKPIATEEDYRRGLIAGHGYSLEEYERISKISDYVQRRKTRDLLLQVEAEMHHQKEKVD